jgi:hypothetical protein
LEEQKMANKKIFLIGMMCLCMLAGAGHAGLNDPAVLNASFEDAEPDQGEWAYYAGYPWGEMGGVWLETNVGGAWQGSDPTPYGNQMLRFGWSASVFQEIGTWSPNTEYEVTVWMAERYDGGTPLGSDLVIELWGGGTTGYAADASSVPEEADLYANTGAIWVDYQAFTIADTGSTSGDVTAILNTSAYNAEGLSEGDPLWVRLNNPVAEQDMSVDNVRIVPSQDPDLPILVAPGNGEKNVPVDTILEWAPSPNHELSYYEVYFGTEPNEAAPGFDMGTPVYTGLDESFDPDKPGTTEPDLDFETTYHWRVDYYEPNAPNPDILWVGDPWSFTTVPPIPLIIENPVNTTVAAGTDALLSIETRNPERYEWYKVGSPDQLIVAVDSTDEINTLTISGTQQADEGQYYCKVINDALPEGVDSSTALVMTKRLVARWEFDNNLNDTSPTDGWDGSIVDPDAANEVVPNVSYVTGGNQIQGTHALHIDNITGEGYVLIDGSEGAFDFYRDGLTVSVWIKRVDFPEPLDWWDPIITYPGFSILSVYPNNWLYPEILGVGSYWLSGGGVDDGNWHLVTMTYDGETMRAYLDGVNEYVQDGTPTVQEELRSLSIGGTVGDLGDSDRITATLDDIQIYSYALSSVEVAVLYTDLAGGTICVQDDDSLPSLQWDISGNCRVDLEDFALFAADWMNCREVPTCLP